ncbi:hypothetical protein [Cyclobacterium sp. SYSU L10401]|uniref:hypothetical protein n=1 Tax=Cyclobacterium sp. SYSU L10401 TaxID=2678657 RepID=UPI0013D7F7D1|nr:hypothetical protein [Cyclobacterium sp. SYSU L10401]
MILLKKHFEKIDGVNVYDGNSEVTIHGISSDIYELDGQNFKIFNLKVIGKVEFCFKNKVIEFINPVFNNLVSFLGNNNKIIFSIRFSSQANKIIIHEPKTIVEYNHKTPGKDNAVNLMNIYCKDLYFQFKNIKVLNVYNVNILNDFIILGSSSIRCEVDEILMEECSINSLFFSRVKNEYPHLIKTKINNFILENIVYESLYSSESIFLPICNNYFIYNINANNIEFNIFFDRDKNQSLKITTFNIEKVNAKAIVFEQNKLDFYEFFILNSNSQIKFNSSNKFEEIYVKIGTLRLMGEVTSFKYVKNLRANNLELNGFNPSTNFLFDEVKDTLNKDGDFVVINSNLNKVTFKPSILHLFSRIFIISSTIQDLQLIGFKYVEPNNIKNKYNGENCDRIEILRFLKNTSDSKKDLNSYLNYKAAEFDETLKGDKNLNWGEKFILYLNKYTNKHSTDWRFAFYEIIFLVVIYAIFLYSILDNDSFDLLISGHIDYLLLPFNFLINIKNELDLIYWLSYVDIGYNFTLSFLIYQMIAAFRKFNK